MLDEIGFGGITLAACEDVEIRHNRIQDNGVHQEQAVCGVLILYGEKVDVSNNQILNNGPRGSTAGLEPERGLRGGVVVKLSFRQMLYEMVAGDDVLHPDGIPAVKVHDNIVTQPLGQALFLVAFGPVSVVGNHFTSQGADFRANPYSMLAGAVFILDLGISHDLMAYMFLAGFRYLAAANTKNLTVQAEVQQILRLFYLPGGNVSFSSNQTTLDLRDREITFALSSQLIASLDDVAYNNNQSDCRSLIDILFTDVALIGATVRSNDNRFQEGFTLALNSLFSFGLMNTAATNQATHCLQVYGAGPFTLEAGNHVLIDAGCRANHLKYAKYMAVPTRSGTVTELYR
jgi:hypothetical protein